MKKNTNFNGRKTSLVYLERDGKYLILHRTKKAHDENGDKWIGVGGKFEPGETPDECALREVKEETGLTMTDFRLRGLIIFVSDVWGTEYMYLYTATKWRGKLIDCDEGELVWLDKQELLKKNLWEGDKLFLKALDERTEFFMMKFRYEGERLAEVVDSRGLSPFRLRVYLELLNVPRGETITYGELARRIGCGSAQAVGQALRHTPFAPEVPCHRVIATDGSLCRFGYVMLLALLVLWPVMIFVRQRRYSLVYQPLSDENFILAVVGIVGGLAAVFLPILVSRLRRRQAEGDVHDYVRKMERRAVAQPTRKTEADEVGNLSLEDGFVWLETNATVPETDAICERLSAMKIGYGVRQMHIDKAFHGIYTTGGGLGTKMGIYVKESDYEQARSIGERIMQRVG